MKNRSRISFALFVKKHLARIGRAIFPKAPVQFADLTLIRPASCMFGYDRGTPVDRYYISRFMQSESEHITGKVLEVEDNQYTLAFGRQVCSSEILHLNHTNPKATMIADLTRVEALPENQFDCFICTQTYNYIYDVQAAVNNSRRLLKSGGALLGSVSGIAQISTPDMEQWGDYWRFTDQCLQRLLADAGFADITVRALGNVVAALAFLQGLAVEDLPDRSLLNRHDKNYQVTVCFKAIK